MADNGVCKFELTSALSHLPQIHSHSVRFSVDPNGVAKTHGSMEMIITPIPTMDYTHMVAEPGPQWNTGTHTSI